MADPKDASVDRRNFLKTAVASAATLAVPGASVAAEPASAAPASPGPAPASAPAVPLRPMAAEGDPPDGEVLTVENPGSDFMVDVLKSLGFEYICSTTGSSFRGLQESVVNYGGNKSPEFLTCCHEEISVAMAHGFAKIEGKPLCIFAHGTVGLQHAAMAIYNAYCDRVPVYVVVGNNLDATMRDHTYGEWQHSVQDAAAMVRDYVKWDDTPISLQHFAESALRAYKIAMTPPRGPVLIVADSELQERAMEMPRPQMPKLSVPAPSQGDSASVVEAARLLVEAENPVIVLDRSARAQAGIEQLVELADLLQAAVVDKMARMNFPTRHPLNHSYRRRAVIANADVILGLDVQDFWGTVNSFRDQAHRTSHPMTKPGTKLISITSGDLFSKANYQDFFRFPGVDLAIAGDAEGTTPALIEAVKRLMTPERRRLGEARRAKLAEASQRLLAETHADASYGWDASPITSARLCTELWGAIKDEDWSLVSDMRHFSNWPARLWPFTKSYQYIGYAGGGGIGYNLPASVGAALANRRHGRLSVNIQGDGDLLFVPTALWTAAHHRIPLLTVVYNNRAYHEEVMHVQRMANRHSRGIDAAKIGTTFEDPYFDYAKIAQGMGVYGEGPISDPKALGPALKRALAVVKKGEPALVDVLTQPR
jgi:acetolactate synthase-1/2/3 large subunit